MPSRTFSSCAIFGRFLFPSLLAILTGLTGCAHFYSSDDVSPSEISGAITSITCDKTPVRFHADVWRDFMNDDDGTPLLGTLRFTHADCFRPDYVIVAHDKELAKLTLKSTNNGYYSFADGPSWPVGSQVEIYVKFKSESLLTPNPVLKVGTFTIGRTD